jgi:amidase
VADEVTTTEFSRMSATDLAQAVRSRQASSQEVIEAHLRRIEAVKPSINAATFVLGDEALAVAKAADRAVARWERSTAVSTASPSPSGTPTTLGVKAMAGAHPARDAPVVERLKAAGAIPIGRTNLAAFTVRWQRRP